MADPTTNNPPALLAAANPPELQGTGTEGLGDTMTLAALQNLTQAGSPPDATAQTAQPSFKPQLPAIVRLIADMHSAGPRTVPVNEQGQMTFGPLTRPHSRLDAFENFLGNFATSLAAGLGAAHGPGAFGKGFAAAAIAPQQQAIQNFELQQQQQSQGAENQLRLAQAGALESGAQTVMMLGPNGESVPVPISKTVQALAAGYRFAGAQLAANARLGAAGIAAQSRENVAGTAAQSRENVAKTQAGAKVEAAKITASSRITVAGMRSDTAQLIAGFNAASKTAQVAFTERMKALQQWGKEQISTGYLAFGGARDPQSQSKFLSEYKRQEDDALQSLADAANATPMHPAARSPLPTGGGKGASPVILRSPDGRARSFVPGSDLWRRALAGGWQPQR